MINSLLIAMFRLLIKFCGGYIRWQSTIQLCISLALQDTINSIALLSGFLIQLDKINGG